MSETSISSAHARNILASVGEVEHFDPLADWYVVTEDDGSESLWRGGDDSPFVVNNTTTSWLGSNAFRQWSTP
jgi:hypothetical protein